MLGLFRFAFAIALTFLGLGHRLCQAQSAPNSTPAIAHPLAQDPGELETALLATDPAQAATLLSRFACASSSNIEAAWDRRDAAEVAGALKDPMVRAAERIQSQRTPIVQALSQVCRVDAIEAAKTIEESSADEQQRAEIDDIQAHASITRRWFAGSRRTSFPMALRRLTSQTFLSPATRIRWRALISNAF